MTKPYLKPKNLKLPKVVSSYPRSNEPSFLRDNYGEFFLSPIVKSKSRSNKSV